MNEKAIKKKKKIEKVVMVEGEGKGFKVSFIDLKSF